MELPHDNIAGIFTPEFKCLLNCANREDRLSSISDDEGSCCEGSEDIDNHSHTPRLLSAVKEAQP